jgi:uncharacterized protein
MTSHTITSLDQLAALYETPAPTSLLKELDHISDDYRTFIDASPFMLLATAGPEGLDCSPRGDPAGFVRLRDPKTLLIPDRRGNNRLDSLRNIVRDPRVALLFLVPGIGETMRVNGTAQLSTDPALCEGFAMDGKRPKCVIVVQVERCYTQCQKAFVRSHLWDASRHRLRSELPTVGQMMERVSKGSFDGKTYDAEYPERMKRTIY